MKLRRLMRASIAQRERLNWLRETAASDDREARWAGWVTLAAIEFPLMSLLSDEQIEAELDSITKNQREYCADRIWLPDTSGFGLKRETDTGKRKNFYMTRSLNGDFPFAELRARSRRDDAAIEREIVWAERRRTYATGRIIYVTPSMFGPFVEDPLDDGES